jgi:hypothetical protein
MTNVRYTPERAAYEPGKPRVFLAFEERSRDISSLLDFGTVIQIFPSSQRWQLTTEAAPDFLTALKGYFEAHDFTDQDAVAAIGDPVVVAAVTHMAARQNGGRVTILKWDRLPCPTCGGYSVKGGTCWDHTITGKYLPITLWFPRK